MDITAFKCGIPVSSLEEKWTSLLLIIQKFITCERRFGSMYMYHIKLLMNFLENQTINLPYFLLSSLKKMPTTVQKNLDDIEHHLYHHGLVKILIEKQLKERKDTWEQLLIRNFFQDPPETLESSSARKSRRRKTSVNIQDTPTNIAKETSKEEKLSERRKERTEVRKKGKLKGRRNIEATYQTPEPSSEEDQILSERLIYLKDQLATTKGKGKEKKSVEKGDTSSQNLRRRSRLKGKLKKVQTKGAHFIDLGGETSEQSPTIPPGHSPQHSPFSQPDFEISPSQPDFGVSPRKATPEIDPTQQEMYDFIKSLEKTTIDQGTSST